MTRCSLTCLWCGGQHHRGDKKHLVWGSHGHYTTTVELTPRPFLGRLCNTGKGLATQDYIDSVLYLQRSYRKTSGHRSLSLATDGLDVWGTVCSCGQRTYKNVGSLCADGWLFSLLLLKLQCCGWPCPLPCKALVKVVYPRCARSHVLYMPQHLTPNYTSHSVSGCTLYLLSPSAFKDEIDFGSRSLFEQAQETATKQHPEHGQNNAQEQLTKENSLQNQIQHCIFQLNTFKVFSFVRGI